MTLHLAECLKTERLVLRAPRASDARTLFATYTQDTQVAQYMVWRPHTSIAETEAFVGRCIHDWVNGLRRPYLLALREDVHQAIGILDARRLDHVIDIGYVLARSHWGRGLMPEAIQALVQAALAIPFYFRVQATCDVENHASTRALEKAGFTREGRLERYTVHPNISPEPRPCFMYGRCK